MSYDYEVLEEGQGSEEDFDEAMQKAINSGVIWKLQGSAGRGAMDALESGFCLLGKEDFRDYYGNHIPSRDQVQAGTKGSYDYVAEIQGKEYADLMASL